VQTEGRVGPSVILCHYYLGDRQLRNAVAFLSSVLGSKRARLVVVTNSNGVSPELANALRLDGVAVVVGDNSLLDFSAYRHGLGLLSTQELSGGVLVINDTLFTKLHYRWLLPRIVADGEATSSVHGPVAVGFSGSYQYLLSGNPWSGAPIHLCSACLFLNGLAAELLIAEIDEAASVLSRMERCALSEERQEVLKSFVGIRFYNYLTAVLLKAPNRVWKPEARIDVSQMMLMRKSVAFYLEHHFSAQVELEGGGLVWVNRGASNVLHAGLLRFALARWRLRRAVNARLGW
jgi:hypothetical protein